MNGDHARLAVLIDADNASAATAQGLLAEVAKYGTAHVKRAYSDWTGSRLETRATVKLRKSMEHNLVRPDTFQPCIDVSSFPP